VIMSANEFVGHPMIKSIMYKLDTMERELNSIRTDANTKVRASKSCFNDIGTELHKLQSNLDDLSSSSSSRSDELNMIADKVSTMTKAALENWIRGLI